MSEYQIFLQERDKIDFLLQKGYKMTNITENLSGAFVDFEKNDKKETLHIVTPEGRKYFTVMLIKQQKEGA
ncbi:hypothetical protein [Bacillus timonensis]|uniref:hypothetical protein n=1 Tax=Bacillus timonensis TaxID=1033734 RepID=UPI00028944D2|nr:hypothetical protein [Bacillus timonensis]